MQQAELKSAFAINLHGVATELQAWAFHSWQNENPGALTLIEQSIAERRDEEVADAQISSTALGRYFRLLDSARMELRHTFSNDELALLLDTHPHPVWGDEFDDIPAHILHSSCGEDEIVDEHSEAFQLCVKLEGLTPLQRVALIDLLECAWRDRAVGPLCYAANALHQGDDQTARS